jgi:dTDP-4-dehydrorhamnose 3,5-epimerase
LSEKAEVFYKCDAFYNKDSEAGIKYNDSTLAIDWQIPAGKELISEKDEQLPALSASKNNFSFHAS